MSSYDYDVLVIGGGTAGLSAYRKLLAEGWNVGLVEPNEIKTTCANVGCMPSKLLIAAAEAAHVIEGAGGFGIEVSGWRLNDEVLWERVRSERDRFVGFVMRGAASIPVIKGWASFVDSHTVEVRDSVGRFKRLTARAFVLASGSRPFVPALFSAIKDEILTNENVFELKKTPKRLAVFGAGVIGVELGMAFQQLGSEVHLFNLGDKFLGLNPTLNAYWTKVLADSFNLHLRTSVESIEKLVDSSTGSVSYRLNYGGDPVIVDQILVATGRKPNLELLEGSGLQLSLRDYDRTTTRLGTSHIFLAGDVNNDIPLLHEASKEGEIAAKSATAFLRGEQLGIQNRLVPLSIVFTTPQVMSVGTTTIDETTIIGEVSFEDQGRSRVMRKNKGLAQLYFDKNTRRLKGAQMIGPDAEHIAHLLAWAIENGNTVDSLVAMPFYHPVIEEGIRTAIRDALAKM